METNIDVMKKELELESEYKYEPSSAPSFPKQEVEEPR
jgi:hypothetical protein